MKLLTLKPGKYLSDFIDHDFEQIALSSSIKENLKIFFSSYIDCAEKHGFSQQEVLPLLKTYIHEIEKAYRGDFQFEVYHQAQREPIDYYQMGLDFFIPILDLENSSLKGIENLKNIEKQIKKGENVVFLANHQVEPDPQLLSCLLYKQFSDLAEKTIYIAGERVVKDPLSIPFSWGRHLLCICSKKHFSADPVIYEQQKEHNKKAIFTLSSLLREGGKALYVAPSGGRDRLNEKGELKPNPFDPDVIEMLYLLAKKAKTPTHFYPLALKTASVLPPPKEVEVEIGEKRYTEGGAIHAIFGKEIDMESAVSKCEKIVRKKKRAEVIFKKVGRLYEEI